MLTKLKKVLSFITIQYRKIARTVFQAYFYDDKKSYFNNDFYLFFEYFYRKQKFLFLSNSFSRLNLLIFFRFIYKEYRFYLIYQITFKKTVDSCISCICQQPEERLEVLVSLRFIYCISLLFS